MRTIAAITIGQSPREDVVPEMAQLTPGVTWVEAGALDGLDDRGIAALEPGAGDFPLVTRVGDGRSVVVGEAAILPRLEAAVRAVEDAADLVVVLCTGTFALASRRPVVYPGRVLGATVAALRDERPVAVLAPHEAQVETLARRWRERGVRADVLAASPYGSTDFAAVGRVVRDRSPGLVVLDCLGYTMAMKAAVAGASGVPTVLVRSLVARIAAELVG